MANTFKLQLKNGEIMVFTSDLDKQEIYGLPQFANQHEFINYFKDKGIILHGIVKPPLVDSNEK